MKKAIVLFFGFLFLLDIILLISLGDLYSKLLLFNPFFYGHETLLIFVALGSFFLIKKKGDRIISTEILFGLAIIYLFLSVLKIQSNIDVYHVFRQFMIFGYGILTYIIVKKFYALQKVQEGVEKGIAFFGILCLIIQVLYVIYISLVYKTFPFFERNYYSPMVILGLIVAASYFLTKLENGYLKYFCLLFLFLISFSVGHDSLYLSIGLVYFTYIFIKVNKKMKIFLSTMFVLLVLSLFMFIPSFTDVNMQWRMIYWEDTLLRFRENYFIFGNGFGSSYVSAETVEKLNSLMTSEGHNFQILNEDNYIIAPHNSFLTMTIHLGIVPLILLIYPLFILLKNKMLLINEEIMFLFLSLFGIVVFSSFNVILELPHSSSIFWIVYFVLVFKLKRKSETLSVNKQL